MSTSALGSLAAPILAADTVLVVRSSVNFPNRGKFHVVIDNEIIAVTDVNGNVWTIARGQEGSVAVNHSTGAEIIRVTTFESFRQLLRSNGGKAPEDGTIPIIYVKTGPIWRTGATDPVDAVGSEGDLYYKTDGNLYQKTSGVYTVIGIMTLPG